MEEVIDVVGDFGPGPVKQEDARYQPEDNFGMAFDVTGLQSDSQQLQLQDQPVMMPPHLGEIPGKFKLAQLIAIKTNFWLFQFKTTTTVSKQLRR